MSFSPEAHAAPVIQIEGLSFRYAANRDPVLSIPKLDIFPGERVFVYGPSGTGKTTLLGLLAGVLPPQDGLIRVLGRNLTQMTPAERDRFRGDHLGYIFQMFNLIPYLSVQDNILLSIDLNSRRKTRVSSMSRSQAALAIARELGIEEFLKRPVTQLSVGQQQRVAVARALLGSPEIIIADEPTSALDYDHRERFLKLLFSECARSGGTVVFVSHDRQLEPLFDRCISLKEINQA